MGELTSKQKAFIDAYMENPLIPMSELAVKMGIPPKTLYRWRTENLNGFKDEMDRRLAEKWEEAKHFASENMFSLAREGNFQANKYILDYKGFAAPTKVEATVDTPNVVIKIGE